MPENIRTRWHKIMPLVEADHVYLTAPVKLGAARKEGDMSSHWRDFGPNRDKLKACIRAFGKLPKFVIDDELQELVTNENYQQSLLDMKRGGVLRLPFPALTVEFKTVSGWALVVLRDNAVLEQLPWEAARSSDEASKLFWDQPFYGVPFRIEQDKDGEYLVMSPGTSAIGLADKDGLPWLQVATQGHDLLAASEKLTKLIGETYVKDASTIWRALAGALLVMHTDGVKREIIECGKINRKRIASKKEPVPKHIVLSIGRVYARSSSSTSVEYVARCSPRPHWRRGHLKTVRFGPKYGQSRQQYINPKLVAFKEFEGTEPTQEYHVKP